MGERENIEKFMEPRGYGIGSITALARWRKAYDRTIRTTTALCNGNPDIFLSFLLLPWCTG